MPEIPESSAPMKRSTWLAIAVGWLTQLGLKALIPITVLVAIRMWSLQAENKALWLENSDDASHPVWFALQGSVFIGSIVAGMLAGLLSPRKSFAVPIWLVLLSLLATAFEQFPRPMSMVVGIVWSCGPCVGLLVGYALTKLLRRGRV